jgi:hypothetical protein
MPPEPELRAVESEAPTSISCPSGTEGTFTMTGDVQGSSCPDSSASTTSTFTRRICQHSSPYREDLPLRQPQFADRGDATNSPLVAGTGPMARVRPLLPGAGQQGRRRPDTVHLPLSRFAYQGGTAAGRAS